MKNFSSEVKILNLTCFLLSILDKEKTQRQFKMYREAKEKEVQSLLKQLRKYTAREGSVQNFVAEGNEGIA